MAWYHRRYQGSSRDEKLLERLRRRPPEADFKDLVRLLEDEGWEQVRQRGSHVSFKKAGERTVTVPLIGGRKVKGSYIDRILTLLGMDDQ